MENSDFKIIMSPISEIHAKILNSNIQINKKLDHISKFLEDNRTLYLNMLTSINENSKKNLNILEKNKKMYSECLKELKNHEKKNMKEIIPILNNMNLNNKLLKSNIINQSFDQSRIYNRLWRSNNNVINLEPSLFNISDK